MFGALVGTLQRFKEEEKSGRRQESEAKRAAQWAKAEQKSRDDAERQRSSSHEPSRKRREIVEIKLEKLYAQLRLLELDELEEFYKQQATHRCHFACTKAEPPLFWSTRNRPHEETDEAVLEAIEDTEKQLLPLMNESPRWIKHERDDKKDEINALESEQAKAEQTESETRGIEGEQTKRKRSSTDLDDDEELSHGKPGTDEHADARPWKANETENGEDLKPQTVTQPAESPQAE